MNAAKLLLSALSSACVLALSAGALAQAKAAPPPELPASAATPDPGSLPAAASPDAPAEEAAPGPVRSFKVDRAPLPKAAPASAPIDVEPLAPPAEDAAPRPADPPHKQRISLGLGFRGGVVESAGYDPYSANNTLPMASLQGSFTPWPMRPVQFSLVAEWDYGGSDATARGNQASLTMHRLALGLESRYLPITRMAFFARLVPAAMRAAATIDDAYLGNKLEASSWTWGLDVTGGAAARVGAVGPNEAPLVSFWLALDMGYRFAGATEMRLRPGDLGEEDQTRKFGEIKMTDLDLSGFIGRLSFSVSF